MSEPFLERLSRFTPAAGGLNRDELLYAAGRALARPNRGWKALASALAATQALSLVLLLPQARPLPSRPSVADRSGPAAPPVVENAPPAVDHRGVWSGHDKLVELEAEKRPSGDLTLIDTGPPLRAFGVAGSPLVD